MPKASFFANALRSVSGVREVGHKSLAVARTNPQIFLYPYISLLFFSTTYTLISATIFANWYSRIFSDINSVAPHKFGPTFGIVSFSVFYAAFVSAYFVCAISATVLAKLEGRRQPVFYGSLLVFKHFFRVTRFALLAVFLFPLGIYAQRRKLPKEFISVIGSSFTLNMALLSPAILTTKKGVGTTIRDALETLGQTWRVGLVLKVGMYLLIFLIFVLPKIIQHGVSHTLHASNVGWLISLELAASGFVVFKVVGAIFTTVLYRQGKLRRSN